MAFMGTAEAEATVTMEPVVAMKKTTAVEAMMMPAVLKTGRPCLSNVAMN